MTDHKKQHYVSQCYLESWCDPGCPSKQTPYVWQFSRDGNEIRRKAPKNIFYEKDMYTIHLRDGTRDLSLERGLSELEALFAQVRNEKTEKRKSLDIEDCAILCAFTAAMHARTKSQREHQRKQWEKPLDMMEHMIEQLRNATEEERKHIASLSIPSHTEGQ